MSAHAQWFHWFGTGLLSRPFYDEARPRPWLAPRPLSVRLSPSTRERIPPPQPQPPGHGFEVAAVKADVLAVGTVLGDDGFRVDLSKESSPGGESLHAARTIGGAEP